MITIVPAILTRLVGRALAQMICTILTVSTYLFGYRILAAYAPFEIDPIIYVSGVLIFHFGLITYLSIRKLED